MDLVQSSDHLCYVRCSFCNTNLAVGIPRKQMLETVTVKCGHCSNLSFLSTRPLPHVPLHDLHHHAHFPTYDHRRTNLRLQGSCSEIKKEHESAATSSSSETSLSLNSHFVVKPPERKHRLPSAYNLFMKEEILRIKAANPEVPHREAFSAAAKNWCKYTPNTRKGSVSSTSNKV